MERPGELMVSGVVGKGLVDMYGHMGQVGWTVDTELEMPLDIVANGVTNDSNQVHLERAGVVDDNLLYMVVVGLEKETHPAD